MKGTIHKLSSTFVQETGWQPQTKSKHDAKTKFSGFQTHIFFSISEVQKILIKVQLQNTFSEKKSDLNWCETICMYLYLPYLV